MEAPDRIFAWRWKLDYPSIADGRPSWNSVMWPAGQEATEYVRADLFEAKVARLAHLLGRQASWVNAALKCQAWQWDVDQREVAEEELAEARAALAEIGGGNG